MLHTIAQICIALGVIIVLFIAWGLIASAIRATIRSVLKMVR